MARPSLEAVIRKLEKKGIALDNRALALVKAHFSQLDLTALEELIGQVAVLDRVADRLGMLPALLRSFDDLTAVLGEPPPGTRELLLEAGRLGMQGAADLVDAQGYAPAYHLPAHREIDYLRRSTKRLDEFWGPNLAKFRQDVQDTLIDGFQRGQMPDQITAALAAKTGIARRHAALIARNETGNAQSYAMQQDQRGLGYTHYIWSTARDIRVRPEHQVREGKVYAWDDPPSDGHPGEPVMCRCTAIPTRDVAQVIATPVQVVEPVSNESTALLPAPPMSVTLSSVTMTEPSVEISRHPQLVQFERRIDAPQPLQPDSTAGRAHLERLDREIYSELYGSGQALREARSIIAELTKDFERNPQRVAIQQAFGRHLAGLQPASVLEEQVVRLYTTRAPRWERLARQLGIPRPDTFRVYRGSRGLDYAFDVAEAWADDDILTLPVVQDLTASWSFQPRAAARFMQDAEAAVVFGADVPLGATLADKLVDGGTFIVPYQNQSEILVGRPLDTPLVIQKELTIVRYKGKIYHYKDRDALIDVLPWDD